MHQAGGDQGAYSIEPPSNMDILRKRWPKIADELTAAEIPPSLKLWRDPEMTIRVDEINLSSTYNRIKEATDQASALPADADEVWIYGLALGELPAVVLGHKAKKIHVVIMNRSISNVSIRVFVHRNWLEDPRVELHLARDVKDLGLPMAVCPADVQLADEDGWELRDRITTELNRHFNHELMAVRYKYEYQQYQENLTLRDNDKCVSELFGKIPGAGAIICMGGPTLAQHYDWLKRHREGHLLIAASTVLMPLQKEGINPDIVMMADPLPAMARHFQGVTTGASLVYIISAYTPILKAWQGKRFYAEMYPTGGELWMDGSVVHASTDLAVKMGCSAVFLIGGDFCYPNGMSHVSGASDIEVKDDNKWRVKARDGHGNLVQSDPNLLQYLRQLQKYVAKHPEVKFYKVGRDGANVPGMEWYDDKA